MSTSRSALTNDRDPLQSYRRKRDFASTPEPAADVPRIATRAPAFIPGQFVVQLHHARRLHCDFRLQWPDGVLKSWAVPKGPSLNPTDKRLAVQVEDHPLDYASFEGVIPAGQYGSGKVIVWDRGEWSPLGDAQGGYVSGQLKFELRGERLNGRWVLVRIKDNDKAKQNWLLIKERDAHAKTDAPFRFDDTATSILNGRSLTHVGSPPVLPAMLNCQLATEMTDAPRGNDWWFETKFDGYRMLARIDRDVQLFSRSGGNWTARFPHVVSTLKGLNLQRSWLDGEVVVFDERGLSRFQALQNALDRSDDLRCCYMVFDAPYLNGADLTGAPLLERKQRLVQAFMRNVDPAVRISAHVSLDPRTAKHDACALGFEGLIAKRQGAGYVGGRSRDWVKLKCRKRQELVVVGYTDPGGSREHFGALLLAYRDGSDWRFAGRVGTGFDAKQLRSIAAKFKSLAQPRAALAMPCLIGPVHWVKPELVVEVAFTEWTEDGLLRQASFIGLREDKMPKVVRREKLIAPVAKISLPSTAVVKLTHPARVIFNKAGALSKPVTKATLARYYTTVAPLMLREINERPLSVVRAPDGLDGERFFQKHLHASFPKAVREAEIVDSHGVKQLHPYVVDVQGLVGMVQMGVVEFHGWAASRTSIETPDRLVFDLDPDERLPWDTVVEAAQLVRAALQALGLSTVVMTSGGKGVHLIAHLHPRYDWSIIEPFARLVAEHLSRTLPTMFVATIGKASRKGRVFIDYLRNKRGATSVVPYSVRLRQGATVATPIGWAELGDGARPADFDVDSLSSRITAGGAHEWRAICPQNVDIAAALERVRTLKV